MVNTESKLYYKLLNIYATHYDKLSDDSKKMVNVLNRPEVLTLDFDEDHLPLEGDEEVKLEPERIKLNLRKRKRTRIGIKIVTPNKLLTRPPILLVQLKTGNNSYKLKIEIRKIQYHLYHHNKIIKNVDNYLIKSL